MTGSIPSVRVRTGSGSVRIIRTPKSVNDPLAIARGSATRAKCHCSSLVLFSKMYEVRFVLPDQFARHKPLDGAPEEIHLGVRGAQCHSRLEDQEHAAIEKKEGADQTHGHRNPCAASAEKRNHADGHAGGHEHSDREIESCQRALQQTRSARQFVELIEEHRPSPFEKIDLRIAARKLL